MNPKLSILICTIPSRYTMLKNLHSILYPQLTSDIEVLLDDQNTLQIGYKRNRLLQAAKGDYISYIDDDDLISENYVKYLMEAINIGCDCSSLRGLYSVDGKEDGVFEHSIIYKEWKTNINYAPLIYTSVQTYRISQGLPPADNIIKYERYPNHLNMIKASIAKQFRFLEINHGEDHDWSKQIHNSGLLKCEHYIPQVIYFYRKVTKKIIHV